MDGIFIIEHINGSERRLEPGKTVQAVGAEVTLLGFFQDGESVLTVDNGNGEKQMVAMRQGNMLPLPKLSRVEYRVEQ